MGHTACTEPQCLYKRALYLYLTVELYLYSPYGPYGLYRASVPVQGCTLPLLLLFPGLGNMRCILNVQAVHELTRVCRSGLKSSFLPHGTWRTWNSSTSIHTARLLAEQLRNQFSSAEEDIFLFFTQSRPAMQLTLPPIVWVPGTHSSELWVRIITFNNN